MGSFLFDLSWVVFALQVWGVSTLHGKPLGGFAPNPPGRRSNLEKTLLDGFLFVPC